MAGSPDSSAPPACAPRHRIAVLWLWHLARRWRAASPARRHLAARAWKRLWLARLALWLWPLERVRRLCNRTRACAELSNSIEECVWAVEAASRGVLHPTCLVRAVALQSLLRESGQTCELVIGVAIRDGQLLSHAWVRSGEEILLGEMAGATYEPLLVIPSHE